MDLPAKMLDAGVLLVHMILLVTVELELPLLLDKIELSPQVRDLLALLLHLLTEPELLLAGIAFRKTHFLSIN